MGKFGNILRANRRKSRLSQRKLAELAGVDFSYISKLENERLPPPSAETIVRMARIMGCAAEELLAAARKMPDDIGNSLASRPAALRFLREAFLLKLSPGEWEEMTGTLRRLRSDSLGGDKK